MAKRRVRAAPNAKSKQASTPKAPRPVASRLWSSVAARQAAPVNQSFRRYSRFVDRAKLVLPLTAAALLVVVGAWPYLSVSLSKLHTSLAVPDAAEIAEVRMVAPHYIGTDRQQRPFSVTARMARQTGQNDDLMALEAPRADLKTSNGSPVTVTGDSGIYQAQAHFLDLSGNVTLSDTKGYVFHTDTARVDLQDGATDGHDLVTGQGPGGSIKAEGFHAARDGESIVFTGHADLIVNSADKKS